MVNKAASSLENEIQKLLSLCDKIIVKDQLALARAITLIENNPELVFNVEERYKDVLAENSSHIVGFTGSPGAGKSTLTDAYVVKLRANGKKVGIIAVDPSSPFTGGALLGDRIRMKRHFTDDNVFIRSMGSRGNVGGLNDSVFGVITLYKLYGFDYVIIETVGAGQSEVDIAYVADTVVLVLSPAAGDEIQLMKAGIMEIADIFVINKSDLEGAHILKVNLEMVLQFSESSKPIVLTVATSGKGIEELYKEIENHKVKLNETGEIKERAKRRIKKHAEVIINKSIAEILSKRDLADSTQVSELVKDVVEQFCLNRTQNEGKS
ncbi:LAO/AO transport system kinase [Fervidobacterium changbaicum]|uniref:Methylmalonyl Co-A mutase-associated GTPase MeaB n=2 Tax=Fervidobacterium TaxID=2422 RepID=A0AAI8CKQ8_FERIS|nr:MULTISPECIES: methylmalonyl Co-A mutase-associated GTPase MeaB [Fervidobacterium]AMW33180.1 methylmalonyl Co-A mutase-associated GTPase MeaB [Fervidobacterium islandicum]QAV33242.1 methylmalonyl Co-A mutase-associated GTPase MeaB [Fervidobacterium changbaicum]SDH05800.1 LAO/AO transport system kinase [Fervidobacterium changbaicum]